MENKNDKKVEQKVDNAKKEKVVKTDVPKVKKITVRGVIETYILNTWRVPEDVIEHVLKVYKDKNVSTFTGNGNPVTPEKVKSEGKAVLNWMKNGLYKTLKITHNFETQEFKEKDVAVIKVRLVPKGTN